MYEGGIKSGARRIMKVFSVLCVIVLFYYFGKVVLSYIDSDGTVMGSGNCENSEDFALSQKAGVFGNLHVKCAEPVKEEEAEGEAEEPSKEKSWRSKY